MIEITGIRARFPIKHFTRGINPATFNQRKSLLNWGCSIHFSNCLSKNRLRSAPFFPLLTPRAAALSSKIYSQRNFIFTADECSTIRIQSLWFNFRCKNNFHVSFRARSNSKKWLAENDFCCIRSTFSPNPHFPRPYLSPYLSLC